MLFRSRVPPCDAVIAIGEVVTYILPGQTAREHEAGVFGFFQRAFEALRPGGLLIFDFMESARRRTFKGRIRAGEDWTITSYAVVSRAGRVLTRRMTTVRRIGQRLRRSMETHRVRVFGRTEISNALKRAGFRVVMRRSIGRVRLIHGDLLLIARKP